MLYLENLVTLYSALEQFDIVSIGRCSAFRGFSNTVIFLSIVSCLVVFFGDKVESFLSPVIYIRGLLVDFSKKLFEENIVISKNIFFYFLMSLFSFILFSNLVGMIPYSVTVTSYIVVTFFFSATGFIASTLIGLRVFTWEFFALFIPSGTPVVLKGPLVFIELVSYFARLFSLAIRLFANMMAGHALLKILSGFAWTFLTSFTCYGLAALVVLMVVWAVTVLELLIAFLQAYVFVVLSSIYLNEAVNLH